MTRKPALTKVLNRILSTLPLLPDEHLSRIVMACNGLMRIRGQAKARLLKGQAQTPTGEAKGKK